jgi:hypothetical protein
MRNVKMLLTLVALFGLTATAGMAQTVAVELDCGPAELTLPGQAWFFAEVCNTVTEGACDYRMYDGEIVIGLPTGATYPNWRHATFPLQNGDCKSVNFTLSVPASPTLVGTMTFELIVTDVTAPPCDDPPAGDMASDSCAIEVLP